jgi:Uma2 family endonuclease
MTTTQAQTPPQPAEISEDLTPAEWFRGYILLPLSEFGQSLDSPKLDVWLEGFAERNKDVFGDLEVTARGELKIMAPTGDPGDLHEAEMTAGLVIGAREHGGRAGGPTSMFILPDGSRSCPDAWWMSEERWNSLPAEARRPFRAVVPDFLVEIVSPSNRGPELEDKVRRYLEGGARLVWVINARLRRVTIYRPGTDREILDNPETLDGGDVLPGFTFSVRERIFDNMP